MTQQTIDRIRRFTEDRDWEQFHTPGNILIQLLFIFTSYFSCDPGHADRVQIRIDYKIYKIIPDKDLPAIFRKLL